MIYRYSFKLLYSLSIYIIRFNYMYNIFLKAVSVILLFGKKDLLAKQIMHCTLHVTANRNLPFIKTQFSVHVTSDVQNHISLNDKR